LLGYELLGDGLLEYGSLEYESLGAGESDISGFGIISTPKGT
jgi:hypothetical protein